MQYRPPNANLDSGCQTVYIVTGDNGLQTLLVGRTWPTLLVIRLVHLCFFVDCGTGHNKHIVMLTKLRYSVMQINVLSMKVYIERNNLQL